MYSSRNFITGSSNVCLSISDVSTVSPSIVSVISLSYTSYWYWTEIAVSSSTDSVNSDPDSVNSDSGFVLTYPQNVIIPSLGMQSERNSNSLRVFRVSIFVSPDGYSTYTVSCDVSSTSAANFSSTDCEVAKCCAMHRHIHILLTLILCNSVRKEKEKRQSQRQIQ